MDCATKGNLKKTSSTGKVRKKGGYEIINTTIVENGICYFLPIFFCFFSLIGVQFFSDGDRYEGEYKDGCFSGYGKIDFNYN